MSLIACLLRSYASTFTPQCHITHIAHLPLLTPAQPPYDAGCRTVPFCSVLPPSAFPMPTAHARIGEGPASSPVRLRNPLTKSWPPCANVKALFQELSTPPGTQCPQLVSALTHELSIPMSPRPPHSHTPPRPSRSPPRSYTHRTGLGSVRDGLHPVQQRLAHMHGSQCGFCTPGFVMSMYSLLRSSEEPPSEEDIEDALGGNLW